MHLQPIVPAEHEAVIRLVNLAYRGDETTVSWSTEARDIAGPRLTAETLAEEQAAHPQGHFLAARETPDSPILGTVWLEPSDEQPTTWYLGLLTIDPTLQNAGLGRRLLAAAEDWAQQKGARRISITVVNTRDTLLAWYERRGYTRTGETKPYPVDARTGKPLREGVHFLVLEKDLIPDP